MFQKKEKRMLQNLMFVKKNFVKRKVLKNLPAPITRKNSMFSAFRMGPATSGNGLCDIDRILFRVGKSDAKKLGSLRTMRRNNIGYDKVEDAPDFTNRKTHVSGIFSSCQYFPIFRHLIYQLLIIFYR